MKYIIANWKSNVTESDIDSWFNEFENQKTEFNNCKVLIAPPYPYLAKVSEYTKNINNMEACSQDVSEYEQGAHTGFVNTQEILDFCKYAIVGHSERHESIETVNKKIDMCLNSGITPIVCFVDANTLKMVYRENVIYAWEDPQNISIDGIYKSKDPQQINNEIIKLKESYANTPFLYGGSVNIENAAALAKMTDLSGVLIGHASLNPKQFLDIISEFEKN